MADLGLSFAPLANNAPTGATGQPQANAAPLQEAIRLLSLRLPRQVASRGLAPSSLLTAPGSAGLPGTSGAPTIEEFLRRLLMGFGTPGQPTNPYPGTGGPEPMPGAYPAPAMSAPEPMMGGAPSPSMSAPEPRPTSPLPRVTPGQTAPSGSGTPQMMPDYLTPPPPNPFGGFGRKK